MKDRVCLVAVLVTVPFIFFCQKQARIKDTVRVDYTMAERTVEWLRFINTGADDASVKQFFMEKVAPTGGCQAIIHHWARFRTWNEETFYAFIMEALGRKPTDHPVTSEDGSLTAFGRRKKLWQSALADPDRLGQDIQALKKIRLKDTALKIAKAYLPDEAVVSNDFYIVAFGASTAFSVGKENGYDLLQLSKTPEGKIDTEVVVSTFAHEMHHSGFSYCIQTYTPELEEDENTLLVGILAAEGMPTYFINKPFDHLDVLRSSPEPLYQALARDWENHLASMPALYRKAQDDILSNLRGDIGQQEIMDSWMGGVQGPAYALGSNMFSVIEAHLGVDSAKSVLKNVLRFPAVYNRAAKIGNEQGGMYFVFDDDFIKKVSDYHGPE